MLKRLCISLVSVFCYASVAIAADVFKLNPSVLIDTVSMDEESRSSVIAALGTTTLQPENFLSWRSIKVGKSEGLFDIVAKEFRYSDARYPLTARALADVVAEGNGIADIDALKEGQTLRIPPLPVRPLDKGASARFAQIVTFVRPTITTHWNEFVKKSAFQEPVIEKPTGSTFVVPKLDVPQLTRFLANIPEHIKRRVIGKTIYVGPLTETIPLITLEAAGCPSPLPSPVDGEAGAASLIGPTLKSEHAGKYYILDLFGKDKNGCSHGEDVYEVARRTLSWFGASQLTGNIVKIELDPSQPGQKEVARNIMYRYVEKNYTQPIEVQLKKVIDQLLANQQSNDGDTPHIPLLLIAAINYDLIRQPGSSVVSSSYYALADGFQWLPDDYKPQSATVLLNAVLNEDTTVEDSTNSKEEPIQTFWKLRRDFGLLLIGAEQCPGISSGMYSSKGDGVSLLAPGYGWGPNCLARGGTSLATPYVGATLLISQAYWRSNNLILDAREVRTRLLLASEINPAYIGRYASGGPPRLERLLRLKGAFAVKADNSIEAINIVKPSTITFYDSDGPHTKYLRRESGQGDDFCGLQISSSGNVYIFREATLRWEAVNKATLSLFLEKDGAEVVYTLDDFFQSYKEVIIL